MDRINLGEALGQIDKSYSSDPEPDNNSDEDVDTSAPIHKVTKQISKEMEELCETYIKSNHTRIVKLKKMTLTTRRLQEVHADL